MKSLIIFILPRKLYSWLLNLWHQAWAWGSAIWYRHPSRHLTVIGITGTKGKSSTTEILANIFRAAGKKVAQSGTIRFQINNKVVPNLYKMSMPGHGFMQRFLRQAVNAGCDVAVVELTSQGAAQHRHKHIELDGLIVTNISPEHIESHGSYENYQAAKRSLTDSLSSAKDTFLVLNAENDVIVKAFSGVPADHVYPITFADTIVTTNETSSVIKVVDTEIPVPLPGRFNAENALLAATAALAVEVGIDDIAKGIKATTRIAGRAELVPDAPFPIVIDYAHTPDSLKAIYETYKNHSIIALLGNTGGGRDTWKRDEMAQIAEKYADHIWLTDEDPYDEDPQNIVDTMRNAMSPHAHVIINLDRRQAIHDAIAKGFELHTNNQSPAVLITGKGTDPYIVRVNGTKEPWSDMEVAAEELGNITVT